MIDVDDRMSELVRVNERINEMILKRNKIVYNCVNYSSVCILIFC